MRGAALRGDDVVEHFMATSNHHWLLFFTTAGRVYRTKAYNLPEASRDAKGGHVAGLLSFQPDESIAQVLAIRDYEQAPYLVLGVDDTRETAEVAVPVVDNRGQVRAVLCASGNPKTFSEEVLTAQVAPQLIRAARAAGRAIGDA